MKLNLVYFVEWRNTDQNKTQQFVRFKTIITFSFKIIFGVVNCKVINVFMMLAVLVLCDITI